ncbi:MAG: hypothetical protein ABI690_36260, partial [Chloroflexota bacterium]
GRQHMEQLLVGFVISCRRLMHGELPFFETQLQGLLSITGPSQPVGQERYGAPCPSQKVSIGWLSGGCYLIFSIAHPF